MCVLVWQLVLLLKNMCALLNVQRWWRWYFVKTMCLARTLTVFRLELLLKHYCYVLPDSTTLRSTSETLNICEFFLHKLHANQDMLQRCIFAVIEFLRICTHVLALKLKLLVSACSQHMTQTPVSEGSNLSWAMKVAYWLGGGRERWK